MARSKSQLTQAKRARETARLEKRARKLEKKEARKLAALDPSAGTDTDHGLDMDTDMDMDEDRHIASGRASMEDIEVGLNLRCMQPQL